MNALPRRRLLLIAGGLLLVVALVAVALTAPRPGAESSSASAEGIALVTSVVDGDTIHVETEDGRRTVRVIGIDTPEIAHDERPAACYGDEAADWVRSRLDGRRVELEPGVEPIDRFGRSLARVQVVEGPLAGRDLSRSLAEVGLARALPIPPNTSDAAAIDAAVSRARRARLGLWGACGRARAFPS